MHVIQKFKIPPALNHHVYEVCVYALWNDLDSNVGFLSFHFILSIRNSLNLVLMTMDDDDQCYCFRYCHSPVLFRTTSVYC